MKTFMRLLFVILIFACSQAHATLAYFSDSIGLAVVQNMPANLNYVIIHSPGNQYLYNPNFTNQPIPPSNPYGWNDGSSSLQVLDAIAALPQNAHYRFIVFNAGLHDMRRMDANGNCDLSMPPRVDTTSYHDNLEALAYLYGQAANKVVWINITTVPAGNAQCIDPNDVAVYNAIGDQVAAEHGFYVLTYPVEPWDAPDDIHFTLAGYQAMAGALDTCINNLINGSSCQ